MQELIRVVDPARAKPVDVVIRNSAQVFERPIHNSVKESVGGALTSPGCRIIDRTPPPLDETHPESEPARNPRSYTPASVQPRPLNRPPRPPPPPLPSPLP